jgi:hypothetical protein
MKTLIDKIKQLPKFVALALAAILIFIVLIYYPVGMLIVHNIDDSPDFKVEKFELENGSHTVAMAVGLIDREVNTHKWVASDPFFYPGSMLVRMPAFQRGIKDAVSRFAIELFDQIGRTRGSSQADNDLQKATGLLNYSPYVWLFDLSTSWLPTTSSTTQYRSAMEALQNYNMRLSQRSATFETRADSLIELLDRMASDLGSSSATIASQIDNGGTFAFSSNADLYYHTKGRMYGYYMLLHALRTDFGSVIKEKQLEPAWDQMLQSLNDGMKLRNFLLFNASPDNQFVPNHLAMQGFYLMRARTQMREITNILLK